MNATMTTSTWIVDPAIHASRAAAAQALFDPNQSARQNTSAQTIATIRAMAAYIKANCDEAHFTAWLAYWHYIPLNLDS